MSRSRISPSLSWSRQMMMAWKVSGLSHSPSIMVSRPASMRLAMAISPSRLTAAPPSPFRADTCAPDRRSGRSRTWRWNCSRRRCSAGRRQFAAFFLVIVRRIVGLLDLVLVDDIDAHVVEHGHDVLDLLRAHLLGGQNRIDLFIGDIAALLGGLDQLLDRGIAQVEQRAVWRLAAFLRLFGFCGCGWLGGHGVLRAVPCMTQHRRWSFKSRQVRTSVRWVSSGEVKTAALPHIRSWAHGHSTMHERTPRLPA